MDRKLRNHVVFNRTNIKQKKYPAKLFYLLDDFFGKQQRMTAEKDLESDFFQGIFREPAHTAIGNPDFIPAADVIEQLDFGTFVNHEKIRTFIVGRTFNCYGRSKNDGLAGRIGKIITIPGKYKGDK